MQNSGSTSAIKSHRIAKTLRRLLTLVCVAVIVFSVLASAIGLGGATGLVRTQFILVLTSSILLVILAFAKKGIFISKIALAIAVLLICFFGLEGAYRIVLLYQQQTASYSYRISSEVYTEFDEKHGERIKPNMTFWNSYIKDGNVVFGTTISKSNADGLGGKTTISEYEERDYKVLIFGDSFSHWNQMGSSWPDLLEGKLNRRVDGSVGVLNYARGTYGVTQMLALAAEKVEQHKPDLIIIAAVGRDFSRGRWWRKDFRWNGYTRHLISDRPDKFLDYPGATDTILVNPEANRSWCERILAGEATASDHGVLDAVKQQHALLRQENERVMGLIFQPFSLRKSHLLSRLIHGKVKRTAAAMPRVPFEDFSEDDELVTNIESLQNSGCPIMLVYLPQKREIDQAKTITWGPNRNLMQSLERIMNQEFILLHTEAELDAPKKMDLRPHDWHPNINGLQWYAQAVAPFAEAVLKDGSAKE